MSSELVATLQSLPRRSKQDLSGPVGSAGLEPGSEGQSGVFDGSDISAPPSTAASVAAICRWHLDYQALY